MKRKYPLTRLLQSSKTHVTIPQYLIENTIRESSEQSNTELDSTIKSILNTISLVSPKKKARVAYIAFSYILENGLKDQVCNDDLNAMIDMFKSSNVYMRNMYLNSEVTFNYFWKIYPLENKRHILENVLRDKQSLNFLCNEIRGQYSDALSVNSRHPNLASNYFCSYNRHCLSDSKLAVAWYIFIEFMIKDSRILIDTMDLYYENSDSMYYDYTPCLIYEKSEFIITCTSLVALLNGFLCEELDYTTMLNAYDSISLDINHDKMKEMDVCLTLKTLLDDCIMQNEKMMTLFVLNGTISGDCKYQTTTTNSQYSIKHLFDVYGYEINTSLVKIQ